MTFNNADSIRVGSTEADKVYLGADLVWFPETAPSWYSVPLDSNIDTYGMHRGEYVTNTTSGYSPMGWVTFMASDFTNNGLAVQSNEISDAASATAYEDFLVNVGLSKLASQGVQDGTPICFDPEDVGFDKALFYHDLYSSWFNNWQSSANSVFKSLNPYSQGLVTGADFSTNINVAAPLIIQTMRNVKARINAVYPNSPVGFYSVGSAAYWLTGWTGVLKNTTNNISPLYQSYQIVSDYFDNNLNEDAATWGWQAMAELDFVFNSYYPAQNDASKSPFWQYSSGSLEYLKNFLHLFIDKFSGTAQGNKMMVGISVRADVTSGNKSGAQYWYADLAQNHSPTTQGQDTPTYWYGSADVHPDFDSIPGMTLGSDPDFTYTPLKVQNDLIKWMFLDTDSAPDGWQSAPMAASVTGQGNTPLGDLVELTGKSLRDFKVAIWDGGYVSTYISVPGWGATPTADQATVLRGLYTKQTIYDAYVANGSSAAAGQWLADAMDVDAADYIQLFSSRGSQDWTDDVTPASGDWSGTAPGYDSSLRPTPAPTWAVIGNTGFTTSDGQALKDTYKVDEFYITGNSRPVFVFRDIPGGQSGVSKRSEFQGLCTAGTTFTFEYDGNTATSTSSGGSFGNQSLSDGAATRIPVVDTTSLNSFVSWLGDGANAGKTVTLTVTPA